MDAQEYWRRRALYAKQKELNSANDYEDAMRSRLKDLQKEIEKEAYKYIELYAKTNNINIKQAANYLKTIDTSCFSMTLKEWEAKAKAGGYEKELNSEYYKSRIARLQQLNSQLSELSSKYATDEEKIMGYELSKEYQDTYYMDQYTKYLAVGGLDVDFAHFNEQQLKDIVYQPWQGSDFSKRVWHNYTKVLPDMLTDVFLRSTLMGYSYRKTAELLRDRLSMFSDKVLHRLVVTEMGHAQEQATEKFYKDSRIEKYQYLATLETHTCEECKHLDHKIFEVDKVVSGENYPLLHPYCRCTTVPYMDDLPPIQSRWYRDPITGKGKWAKRSPSYKEWKEINGIKSISEKKFLSLPSGALNESMPNGRKRMDNHAKLYYQELRNSNRNTIVNKIKRNTSLKEKTIRDALTHILDSKYELMNGSHKELQRFYPDYDMAQSLQRLLMNAALEHDIIMLEHEALEAYYMDELGMNYSDAHKKTNEQYNYQKALLKYRKERDKS